MPFAPGQSGNPNGRPKHTEEMKEALEILKKNTPQAARVLVQLMYSEDDRVKAVASNGILDRVLGKPQQAVQLEAKVASFVARLPQVVESTAQWMEQYLPKSESGSHTPDHKQPTLVAPSLK